MLFEFIYFTNEVIACLEMCNFSEKDGSIVDYTECNRYALQTYTKKNF